MNDNHSQEVLRPRSSQASIAAGYKAFFHHFRNLFRATWLSAVGYALLFAAISEIFGFLATHVDMYDCHRMTFGGIGIMALVILLYWVNDVFLRGNALGVLKEHLTTQDISRSPRFTGRFNVKTLLRTACAYMPVNVLDVVILFAILWFSYETADHFGPIAVISATLVLLVLKVVLFLPFAFGKMKYVLVDDCKLKNVFGRDYLAGLRHVGALLATWLITGLVSVCLTVVVALPANVLITAETISKIGIELGDPSGMPGYMAWVRFVATFFVGFVLAYVQILAMFPYYYLFGSIEKKSEARKS